MKRLYKSFRITDTKYALILLIPAIILLTVVIIIPLIRSVGVSFKEYSLLSIDTSKWVGIKNYIYLFSSKDINRVISNTIIFVLLTTICQFVLGFSIALLLNLMKKARNFFSGIILFNWITPTVVVAFVWIWIFQPDYGILNYTLYKFGIISNNITWISHPQLAMVAIMVAHVWKYFPFMMVMLLAGLQTIPNSIIEASLIDGTNVFSRFLYITLPYLRNIIMITTLLGLINNFQSFTLIWLITQGGPINRTTTLSIDVYRKAFELYDMGLASAVGVVWLMFLIVISFFFVKYMRRSEID